MDWADIQQEIDRRDEKIIYNRLFKEIGDSNWSYEKALEKKIMGSIDGIESKRLKDGEIDRNSKETSYLDIMFEMAKWGKEYLVEKVRKKRDNSKDMKHQKMLEFKDEDMEMSEPPKRKKRADGKNIYLQAMKQTSLSPKSGIFSFVNNVLIEGDTIAYNINGNVFSKSEKSKEILGIDKNNTVYELKWGTLEGKPVIKGRILGMFKSRNFVDFRDSKQHKFVIGTVENAPVILDEKTLSELKRKSIFPAR